MMYIQIFMPTVYQGATVRRFFYSLNTQLSKGRKTISLPLADGWNHGSAFIPTPTENYVG